MNKIVGLMMITCLFVVAGCQSTLDKEATALMDKMTQDISHDLDEANVKAVERGEMTSTTKKIRDERSHKARRLARAMARDADEDYKLPAIPRDIEEEPEPVTPDSE
jgi:hypothetical protein